MQGCRAVAALHGPLSFVSQETYLCKLFFLTKGKLVSKNINSWFLGEFSSLVEITLQVSV